MQECHGQPGPEVKDVPTRYHGLGVHSCGPDAFRQWTFVPLDFSAQFLPPTYLGKGLSQFVSRILAFTYCMCYWSED